MTRRLFVTGIVGKSERINVEAVRTSDGWQRLLRDIHAHEQQARRDFDARMLRPAMPRIPS